MARRELTYYDISNRRSRSSSRRRTSGFGGFGAGSRRSTGGSGRRTSSPIDWIMTIVSVAIAAGTVLSWAARWINPSVYGFLSVAGLFMPVLMAANFLCLLYWTIRWRKGVFIPLVIFVVGIWSTTLFFRPSLTRKYDNTAASDRSLVDVMSYNVRGMMRPEASVGRSSSSMRDVVAVVDSLRPDILCIQEFQSTPENPASAFEDALPIYRYKRVRFNIAGTAENHGWGNAVYSKFPVTNSGYIDFDGTNNSILWADIAVGRDTVRVFNSHLQTTAIKASDEQYLVEGDFVGDSTRTSRVRRMVGALTQNYIIRAGQADTLARRIASSPYPVIVCGDFNDTPVSYAYRRIAHRLRDGFREAGHGYGYTYRGFFNLLRIDYVLHSPSMECVEYLSPSLGSSDHNPVAVKMRIGQ